MHALVTYDVNTEDRAGKNRLRHVATICKDYGQRVQYSVFECQVTRAQFEEMEDRLASAIDPETDSLRIYRLPADRDQALTVHGLDAYTDFDDPLVF